MYIQKRKKVRYIVLLFVVFFAVAAGYYFWDDGIELFEDPRILNSQEDICSSNVASNNVETNITRQWLIKDPPANSTELSSATITAFGIENDTYHIEINDAYRELEPLSSLQNEYSTELEASDLDTGNYDVILYEYNENNGCHAPAAEYEFYVSYPMYVVTSLDWEGYDATDEQLKGLEKFATKFNTPFTHFFNPRIYIPNVFSSVRAEVLTDWVLERENDEIGLHLHMYKDMVEEIGVTPIMEPTWDGRATGSDVPMTVYSQSEVEKMLQWSKEQFATNGLPVPKGFRAGGWFANTETLQALENEGFLYDSSGRTSAQIGSEDLRVPWSLRSTTQPYQPSKEDINDTVPEPQFELWEVPNNGLEGFRNSPDQLVQNFEDNYPGGSLEETTVLTYLIHPQVADRELPKMTKAYETVSTYTASNDSGPVIFTTMEDVYQQITD